MGALADVPTGILTGLPGSIMAAPDTITLDHGEAYIIPAGCYYLLTVGADIELEVNEDDGPTWAAVLDVAVGGLVYSDGTNVQLNNTGSTSGEDGETAVLIKIG